MAFSAANCELSRPCKTFPDFLPPAWLRDVCFQGGGPAGWVVAVDVLTQKAVELWNSSLTAVSVRAVHQLHGLLQYMCR